ncbi:hypothetical protein BYT27DRAFT_7219653 [Phlegmacium glaucopus]|nr:hypothetical protein BYT27DRAFT_7219653 [Phlegmacium glaucopus]
MSDSKLNEEKVPTFDSGDKYNMGKKYHDADSADVDSDVEPSFPYEYRGRQINDASGSVEETTVRATKDQSDDSEDELTTRAAKKNKDGKKVKKAGAKKND